MVLPEFANDHQIHPWGYIDKTLNLVIPAQFDGEAKLESLPPFYGKPVHVSAAAALSVITKGHQFLAI